MLINLISRDAKNYLRWAEITLEITLEIYVVTTLQNNI